MNREQQLARLLEGWLDGGIDESEQEDLLASLGQDAELRRAFAEEVATLGAIRAVEDAQPRWLALFDLLEEDESDDGKGVDLERSTMAEIERISRRRHSLGMRVLAAAAAVTLLLAVGALFQWWRRPDPIVAVPPPAPVTARPVAVTLAREGGSAESAHRPGTFLAPGSLKQQDGWVSIQTLHGVTITLQAPFETTLVAHDEIELAYGSVRVHVPDGAEGFRVRSRAFVVTDLGTEFGVQADEDGSGRCRVFNGEADVSLIDSLGVPTASRRLRAAESTRIEPSQQAIETIEEEDGDYPEIKLPPPGRLALKAGYPEMVKRMGPSCYWRFEFLDEGRLVRNDVENAPDLFCHGAASISEEAHGNHAGLLTGPGFFTAGEEMKSRLQKDWTISFFVRFQWMQNFALIAAQKFSPELKGHSFLLQAYSSFSQSGLNGTGLHAVVRDPPAWDGGVEVFGNTLLSPRCWHHIAAVRKGGELALFQNGKPAGRQTVSDAGLKFDSFFVGRLNGNPDQSRVRARRLVGRIDELAVFNRALEEGEIRELARGSAVKR